VEPIVTSVYSRLNSVYVLQGQRSKELLPGYIGYKISNTDSEAKRGRDIMDDQLTMGLAAVTEFEFRL
jgi:hypothetical protein